MIIHAKPKNHLRSYHITINTRISVGKSFSSSLLATNRFPKVQNAAIELNMEPRFSLGWNSAKYDHITGPLPPNLKPNDIFNDRVSCPMEFITWIPTQRRLET